MKREAFEIFNTRHSLILYDKSIKCTVLPDFLYLRRQPDKKDVDWISRLVREAYLEGRRDKTREIKETLKNLFSEEK